VAGAYVAWYGWLELRTYRSSGGSVPSSSITEQVAALSADVSDWINRVGAVPLAVVLVLVLGLAALWASALRTPTPAPTAPDAPPEGNASPSDAPPSGSVEQAQPAEPVETSS
jgi:hypothetical protein